MYLLKLTVYHILVMTLQFDVYKMNHRVTIYLCIHFYLVLSKSLILICSKLWEIMAQKK